ncbi:uncharacterized protein F5147DRAFT_652560 [Suillus discolor]|uniref:Uncharacterized protein n=1 Tax=Suillus discolor TaxID=1912936 RepID=A0A9P7F6S4_9AGAM|nr:uncharacterized protein F5147DRAFT_652560 [Suillus discolor]KAG2108983.1 hypothetical protein F5147DRAFT_652560 [Suillus discolor]
MEPPSSPSSTITTPPNCHEIAQRSGKLIAMAMTCRSALLHYDHASKSMVEWCWPADDEGKKIPPSDLEKSCEEYDFQYPCCLCADEGGKEAYVEAAVYPWWDTITKKTHWTARCASDTCGYRVKINTIHFQLFPLAAFRYPRREQQVPPVQFEWTNQEQTELLNRLASSNGNGIAIRLTSFLVIECSGLDALPRLCVYVMFFQESVSKVLQEFQPYGFMMHILRISLSESPIDMRHHCMVRQSEDTWGIMHFHMKDDLRPLHTSQKDKKEMYTISNLPGSQISRHLQNSMYQESQRPLHSWYTSSAKKPNRSFKVKKKVRQTLIPNAHMDLFSARR